LAASTAVERCEIEPFVSFYEVDWRAAASGRIDDPELEQGIDVPILRITKSATDQEFRALLANRTHDFPLKPVLEGKFGGDLQKNG
jgi:hypothetical protein